jgi:arginine/lysine/ornithine decarboxylase
MLTSTHKIAGSLTQSAMLHISGSGRIDIGAVARALRLLRSTSPSSLLIASLDGARRQLALHGEQLLFETLEAIQVARAKFETIPGIAMVDASLIGRMGVAGYDPMRIVLDVRGTGRTGYEIADELRRSYDVHVELPMQATIVFIVGLGESASALRRLAGDVDEVVKRLSEPGATAPIVPPATSLRNEMALPPREAFLGEAEQVAVDDAIGRISCESIASYPPGVPALLPGERISRETVDYLRELAWSGARLHGASDPAFKTINVLREGP